MPEIYPPTLEIKCDPVSHDWAKFLQINGNRRTLSTAGQKISRPMPIELLAKVAVISFEKLTYRAAFSIKLRMLLSNERESIFEIVYRRLVPRLGHNKTIGVIAHRLCHLIWIILHNGVRYEERGPAVSKQFQQRHTARMIRKLRMLGYRVEPIGAPA
jgi:hypothetical protein